MKHVVEGISADKFPSIQIVPDHAGTISLRAQFCTKVDIVLSTPISGTPTISAQAMIDSHKSVE